jgi:hypothetical protein
MAWKFRIFNRRCRRWTQMAPLENRPSSFALFAFFARNGSRSESDPLDEQKGTKTTEPQGSGPLLLRCPCCLLFNFRVPLSASCNPCTRMGAPSCKSGLIRLRPAASPIESSSAPPRDNRAVRIGVCVPCASCLTWILAMGRGSAAPRPSAINAWSHRPPFPFHATPAQAKP